MSAPDPSACPDCGGVRLLGEGGGHVRVAEVTSAHADFGRQRSSLYALVCSQCGLCTWYAKTPFQPAG